MAIIDDIFYGRYNPHQQTEGIKSEIDDCANEINRYLDRLNSTLSAEQRKSMEILIKRYTELAKLYEYVGFCNGVKLRKGIDE